MLITFFQISLATSICMMLMWGVYQGTLSQQKNLSANRLMILLIFIFCLMAYPAASYLNLLDALAMVGVPRPLEVLGTGAMPKNEIPLLKPVPWIWAAGFAVCVIMSLVEYVRVAIVMLRSRKAIVDGRKIYITFNAKIAPFTIGNAIVLSHEDFERNLTLILRHEAGHCIHHHTLDLMLAQAMCCFCWYNPAAWLMKRELKKVHEHQADEYVLVGGVDPQEYQYFLVRRVAGSRFTSVADNLNCSQIKDRIRMMNRSGNTSIWRRALYLLPLAAFAATIPVFARTHISDLLLGTIYYEEPVWQETTMEPSDDPIEVVPDDDTMVYIDGKLVAKDGACPVDPEYIQSISVHQEDPEHGIPARIEIITKK